MTWVHHGEIVEIFDEAKTLGRRGSRRHEFYVALLHAEGDRVSKHHAPPAVEPSTSALDVEHDGVLLSLQRKISISPENKSLWLVLLHRHRTASNLPRGHARTLAPILLRYNTATGRFVDNQHLNGNTRYRELPAHILVEFSRLLGRVHAQIERT